MGKPKEEMTDLAPTGAALATARIAIMSELDQLWSAFEKHQPVADAFGYGKEWQAMTTERTAHACLIAATRASFMADHEMADLAATWAMYAIAPPHWADQYHCIEMAISCIKGMKP
jgi:hypothetical protein